MPIACSDYLCSHKAAALLLNTGGVRASRRAGRAAGWHPLTVEYFAQRPKTSVRPAKHDVTRATYSTTKVPHWLLWFRWVDAKLGFITFDDLSC